MCHVTLGVVVRASITEWHLRKGEGSKIGQKMSHIIFVSTKTFVRMFQKWFLNAGSSKEKKWLKYKTSFHIDLRLIVILTPARLPCFVMTTKLTTSIMSCTKQRTPNLQLKFLNQKNTTNCFVDGDRLNHRLGIISIKKLIICL